MRIIAAIIAFICCTFEGWRRSLLLKKRVARLGELTAMLNGFSIEIRCRALPLDELIESAEGEFAQTVLRERGRGTDIRTAWDNACEALPKERERVLLEELGRSFGRSDREGQLALLELYSAQLGALKDEAERCCAQKAKAFSQVGTLCGIAAAILII